MESIGIDVHKVNSQVGVVGENAEVLEERRIQTGIPRQTLESKMKALQHRQTLSSRTLDPAASADPRRLVGNC